jgi:23S rRNA pseudouridine2604 synthase
MRINKFIGERGVCSRREADKWIEAGRISVNGVVAVLGTQVTDADDVRLDGQPLGDRRTAVYLMLNKPTGVECTTNRSVAGNIIDFLNYPERIFPIGRLDKDSDGLILLTNNGDIVNSILRAENEHEKEYIVTVDRPVSDLFLSSMSSGVRVLGRLTEPCRINLVSKNVFRIVLTQGMNRQIRRMCSALGYTVRRLQRVRIMNVRLGDLPPGRWRALTKPELVGLLPELSEGLPSEG